MTMGVGRVCRCGVEQSEMSMENKIQILNQQNYGENRQRIRILDESFCRLKQNITKKK